MSTRGRSPSPRSGRDDDVDMDRGRSRTPPPPSQDGPRVIIIQNLTRNVAEVHLRTIFGFYGNITTVDLPIYIKSGQNKGKAALEYDDTVGAEKAVAHMNNGQLDGAVLSVALSDLPIRKRSRSRSPLPPPRGPPPPRGYVPRLATAVQDIVPVFVLAALLTAAVRPHVVAEVDDTATVRGHALGLPFLAVAPVCHLADGVRATNAEATRQTDAGAHALAARATAFAPAARRRVRLAGVVPPAAGLAVSRPEAGVAPHCRATVGAVAGH
ncbi:unnamed protein product [Peniophora sp. CBMAI 1063]|nr:unnamed protein product [Peniophora sp. CBMAI 1063]